MLFKYRYQRRDGQWVYPRYTKGQALIRLGYLERAEVQTKKYAPTDSGEVRFNYNAEAAAIRAALAGDK